MAGEPEQIGQDEIERLLKQAESARPLSMPAGNSAEAGATLGHGELESLLQNAAAGQPLGTPPPGPQPAPRADVDAHSRRAATLSIEQRASSSDSGPMAGDIEFLLRQAEEALASVNAPVNPMPPLPVAPFKLQDFSGTPASTETATLDLIRDVELNLKIELGRTHMYLEDVLKLRKGSVVPLDKLAGDPVDIYVNGRLIARGEVLVLNDNFAVRVAELVTAEPAA